MALTDTSPNAMISLSFDDGMPCHLETVVPILERHGLRGTFYVCADGADGGRANLERFAAAAANGHEIGNHSIHHYWSIAHDTAPSDRSRHGVENLSLPDMGAELDEAIARFKAVFPGVETVSFAYPGYATYVGRGAGRASYVPLVAERFPCARGGGMVSTPWNAPGRCDLHCLNSWQCESLSAEKLIEIVDRTLAAGTWSILTFHGVGEGHLAVETEDFEKLAAYLAHKRDVVRTAPVVEIAKTIGK